ncbi:DUF3107 domain-containing protein [Cellulomonas soli]|uniref:DUF3107 domain-containing protein n=1 Tax=Cellulomonas soli TaxID=931535 RepID=UPI003F84E43D
MDITIGVRNQARELVLESDQSADEISAAVTAALTGKVALELTDAKGRRVIVPTEALGFVELGTETRGRVGFGTI